MYISMVGNKLTSELDKLIDTIRINLTLDINDIPFTNLGIVRNFSKNTYSDTVSFIKLQINDMLKANNYSGKVSISKIEYDQSNNEFVISLSAGNEEFSIVIDGGE